MALSTQENTSLLLGLSNDLAGAVAKAGGAIVAVNARQRVPSTGIHWSPGVIVTSDHTVERDEEITVTLADGRAVPATLAGRDPSTDIAVLKVQGVEAPTAEVAQGALAVGQIVLALGRPGEHGLSASYGVISALSGSWSTYRGGQIDQFMRPDLTFYPGFSGGPLINAHGQVVGLNTSGLTRGLGVTIPASTVNRVADQLLTKGRIARGYLGLGFQPVHLPDSLKSTLNLAHNGGLIVVTVEPGGPAEKAGMFIGDVLVALDNTPVTDVDAVQAMLGGDRVGKAINARVVRGGALTDVAITVAERPQRGE